ncbi:hypothetical protein DB346_09200 [Verrucomicrobia bacterium LW23]|nr:hypothetical protein DB346_09200 [Verrucomicrobia bacterium LW23]
MPRFSYTALRTNGEKAQGTLEARNRSEALQLLSQQKLRPTKLEDTGAAGAAKSGSEGPGSVSSATTGARPKNTAAAAAATAPSGNIRLSGRQLADFTEELGDLLDAGMALDPALRVMEQRKEESAVKQVATLLRQQVREGVSLSTALRKASASFGDLYCNLVAAGEASGALPAILKRQYQHLVMMSDIRAKALGALVYPAVIAACGLALMFIVSIFLGPQLENILGKMGRTQPLATRVLIAGSNFVTMWWWLILLGMGAAAAAFFRATQSGPGRDLWHRWQLRLPLIGPIVSTQFYATLCHTLATLVASGIPLLNALRLVTQATPNIFIRDSLERASELVAEGVPLSRALARHGSFPSALLDFIAVGEQTGDLAASLGKAGARYDKELSRSIIFLTSLIQPAIIIVMALLVGLVAYAIVSGIFSAVSGLRVR